MSAPKPSPSPTPDIITDTFDRALHWPWFWPICAAIFLTLLAASGWLPPNGRHWRDIWDK